MEKLDIMFYQLLSFSYFHLTNIPPAASLKTDLSFSVKRRLQFPACPFGRKDAIPSLRLACHSSSGLDAISSRRILSSEFSTFFTPRKFQSLLISSKGVVSRSS